MTRKVLGVLVLLAFPVAGVVAIVVVSARHPWPTVPLTVAAAVLGFLAWFVLSGSRFATKQLSWPVTIGGIAAAIFVTGLLKNASDVVVVTGVAVIEGFVIPVLWRVLVRKQGYRSDGVLS
jgi:hypothetical protein